MTAPLRFSIVLPTHNRLAALRRAVAALDRLEYDPARYEILVVDDGSTDGTADYLATRTGQRLHAISQPRAGAAAARNAAIRRARGEVVAFTDDDCTVPPDWLGTFDALFRTTGADVIGGSVKNGLPALLSQFYQDMATHLYERQNVGALQPEFLSANNLAIRRAVLLRDGPFDARFFLGGEDRELVRRLAGGGARVLYRPELTIRHYHAFTLRGYARHCFRMGRGSYLLHRVIPRERNGRPARPDPRIYREFLGRLLGASPAWQAPLRVGLFALAQASVMAGFVAARVTAAGGARGGARAAAWTAAEASVGMPPAAPAREPRGTTAPRP